MPIGPVSGGGGFYNVMTPEQGKAYAAARQLKQDLQAQPPNVADIEKQLAILDQYAKAHPNSPQAKFIKQLDTEMQAYKTAAGKNPPDYQGMGDAMEAMITPANNLINSFL